MRRIYLLLLVASLGANGCSNEEDTIDIVEKNKSYNRLDFNSTSIIKQVYAAKNKVKIFEAPDVQAKVLNTYDYGTVFYVIGEMENWFILVARDSREFSRSGFDDINEGWEKAYVEKKATTSLDQIQLEKDQLMIIDKITVNELQTYYDGAQLNRFLKVELIPEKEFISAKRNVNKQNEGELVNASKTGSKLSLSIGGKNFNVKDSVQNNESTVSYQYKGFLPYLESCIIEKTSPTTTSYLLLDSKTGTIAPYEFIAKPYISPYQNYILALHRNEFESNSTVQLWKIDDKKPSQLATITFRNWLINDERHAPFFASNGTFYCAINHSKVYIVDGKVNPHCQYMKLTIL